MTEPILKGEGLYKLIPQRPPIVMVDTFFEADAVSATTGLTIKTDNIFCLDDTLQEPGLICSLHTRRRTKTGIHRRGEEIQDCPPSTYRRNSYHHTESSWRSSRGHSHCGRNTSRQGGYSHLPDENIHKGVSLRH